MSFAPARYQSCSVSAEHLVDHRVANAALARARRECASGPLPWLMRELDECVDEAPVALQPVFLELLDRVERDIGLEAGLLHLVE